VFAPKNLDPALKPTDPRFGCGPSLVPLRFLKDLEAEGVHLIGTSHRKAPVKNLVARIKSALRQYYKLPDDYTIVLGNGGATLLFDMIALGVVEKKVIHYTCGEFSNKWFKSSAKVPWIEAREVAAEYGEGIEVKAPEEADLIACTLNETSTGVQIKGIPLVKAHQVLAVDATSGAGQIKLNMDQVDLYFFSTQKVFAAEGGLFVAFLSPKAKERALKINEDQSRYIPEIMNWKTAIVNSDKDQTYNTPSISTLYLLARQVEDMNERGEDVICKEANRKAELIYQWASEKSYLNPYIKKPDERSRSVATIDVAKAIPVDTILKYLADKQWVYGIDSYRKLGRNQVRISLFDQVTYGDLEKLTKILSILMEPFVKESSFP